MIGANRLCFGLLGIFWIFYLIFPGFCFVGIFAFSFFFLQVRAGGGEVIGSHLLVFRFTVNVVLYRVTAVSLLNVDLLE